MGICSRQERIQKAIDVVIEKCKAEKDYLFTGEFPTREPGRRRGGCRCPLQTPLPLPELCLCSSLPYPGAGAAELACASPEPPFSSFSCSFPSEGM